MNVARSSTYEVALSQLADSRASNPNVNSFAQMMITDHTQANSDPGYTRALLGDEKSIT
jgi:predicted outer membrane protein